MQWTGRIETDLALLSYDKKIGESMRLAESGMGRTLRKTVGDHCSFWPEGACLLLARKGIGVRT